MAKRIAVVILAGLIGAAAAALLSGCVAGSYVRAGGVNGVEIGAHVAVMRGSVETESTKDGMRLSLEARARVLEALQSLPAILEQIPTEQLVPLLIKHEDALRRLRERQVERETVHPPMVTGCCQSRHEGPDDNP